MLGLKEYISFQILGSVWVTHSFFAALVRTTLVDHTYKSICMYIEKQLQKVGILRKPWKSFVNKVFIFESFSRSKLFMFVKNTKFTHRRQ